MSTRSLSEKGVGQLLEKSRQLLKYIESLEDYSPTDPALTPAGYKAFLDSVAALNSAVASSLAALRQARAARHALYHGPQGLIKRASRIRDYISSLPTGKKSSDFTAAQKICQSLRPSGAKKAPEPDSTASAKRKKEVSQYELSFGAMLEKARQLEQIILLIPGYAPSAADITPAGLDALLDDIELKNAEVAAKLAIANKKIENRAAAYANDPAGLRGRVTRIKAAIAAQYGRNSPEYKNVLEIRF
jgi:hypothetical protein